MSDSEQEHFVYIIECTDGTLYTGYTTDVERRVEQHNNGKGAKYTRGRTPVTLRHVESFPTQSAAQKREHKIKQFSPSRKQRLFE